MSVLDEILNNIDYHVLGGDGNSSFFSNLFARASGSSLTNAEREANAFSAQQSELAFQRSLLADSTKYQRTVEDMKAAGVNPMLALTGGASGSIQSSPASSVSPAGGQMNLGSLLSFVLGRKQLALQSKLTDAQVSNINADTAKKQSETTGINIENSVSSATADARKQAAILQNQLTRTNIKSLYKGIDEAESRITKNIEQAHSEQEKQNLMVAQRMLANANAEQIIELLPYQKMLASAQSESARQAAVLSAVSAAYKQGLINNGYIESFAREMAASAGVAENNEVLSDIKTALRTGDYSDVSNYIKNGPVSSNLLQAITVFLDNLNPLNNILK